MSKLILLIVVALSLSGCVARSSSLAKATGKIEPCSLLTKEEAAAALGGKIQISLTADSRTCSYNLAATNGTRYASIVVVVVTPDSPDFQKFGSSQDSRTDGKPISGIGDKAILFMSKVSPDKGAKAMQVLKGNLYLGIGMSTSTPPVSEDVLKSLAMKAVSRLP
jgi:hypothetical protein